MALTIILKKRISTIVLHSTIHVKKNPTHKWGGLGEFLGGNELIDSQMEKKFGKTIEKNSECTIELDATKVKQMKEAIENAYWFEFFMDDLPLWGFVGEFHPDKSDDKKHFLHTHKNIIAKINNDQIIHVNLSKENPKPLVTRKTLERTYSIN